MCTYVYREEAEKSKESQTSTTRMGEAEEEGKEETRGCARE